MVEWGLLSAPKLIFEHFSSLCLSKRNKFKDSLSMAGANDVLMHSKKKSL